MPRAFVALGANLVEPQAQVRAALAELARLPQSTLVAASSLYRTAPVGLAGQPDFINAVAALDTSLSPDDLLEALFAIERSFGRVRKEKNGPRTLDLDLLLYDNEIIDTPHLHLPHPRLHLRAFVVVPLAEIAPDCRLPGRGTVAAWLPAVANQQIERLP
ncbi:MAG: 2-amino-4-hydroxy-6-hydroxymethyldihydropteridine diphosphokinase [Pseudomonadota bacterium]|nr:2-amino-4-hydroxy-6-hydroxymethyldihydropteridine diphosphokinase [Pseudomonadota bacterium]MDQ5943018.1 2-amino-4-hydroxy-6-hydroxymethyldihydropteridine diphosphokinase [Pseudomonadota bacterium]